MVVVGVATYSPGWLVFGGWLGIGFCEFCLGGGSGVCWPSSRLATTLPHIDSSLMPVQIHFTYPVDTDCSSVQRGLKVS